MVENIWEWLKSLQTSHFPESQIYLFGSILVNPETAHDCDAIITYRQELIDYIVDIKPQIRRDFKQRFGIPLHLHFFSYTEAEEFLPLFKTVEIK